MTRSVPNAFGPLVNPSLPNLDNDFAALTPAVVLPCTATGTNLITLTPVTGTLNVTTGYTDKEMYSFDAPATSTGVMTLQVQALPALKLFKAGGVSQATTGDIVNTQFYIVAYQAALDSANGGFVIVSATNSGTFATKTDMQQATSSVLVVSPAQVTNSPFAAKAWANVSSAGAVLTGANLLCAHSSTGVYSMTFTSSLPADIFFAPSVTPQANSLIFAGYFNRTATGFAVSIINSVPTAVDNAFSVIVYGNL